MSQAEVNLEEAQTRSTQLEEQLKLEKEANERKLEEAKNNLKIAKLQLKLLSPEVVRPEEVKRSEASVAQSKANFELAQKEFDRKENLYEKSYISKSELDTSQTQLDAARAQHDSAQQQLEMVKTPAIKEELDLARANIEKANFAIQAAQEDINAQKYRDREMEMQNNKVALMEAALALAKSNLDQIEVRKKDLTTAQASVSRSESQLKDANERLDDTLVTAPISGTILEKNVEEGQVISSRLSSTAGEGTPLITMADLTKIYVRTDVDENDIGKVQPGQFVTIKVDAFPNQVFDGEVLKIAPQGKVTQNVTTFEVTTELIGEIDAFGILKPGMNAEVEIMAASANNALLVPNEAIMNSRRGKIVQVIGEDGKPTPRPVETGASNWEKTAIISGLFEGEVVLIGGSFSRGEGGSDRFERMRERMRRDPTSGFRRMQGGGRRGGGPR